MATSNVTKPSGNVAGYAYSVLEDASPPYDIIKSDGILLSTSELSYQQSVPSRSGHVSSGFDYPSALVEYGISEDEWREFWRDIAVEAKLSLKQKCKAAGKGLGVLFVGGLMIGVFSTVPAYVSPFIVAPSIVLFD